MEQSACPRSRPAGVSRQMKRPSRLWGDMMAMPTSHVESLLAKALDACARACRRELRQPHQDGFSSRRLLPCHPDRDDRQRRATAERSPLDVHVDLIRSPCSAEFPVGAPGYDAAVAWVGCVRVPGETRSVPVREAPRARSRHPELRQCAARPTGARSDAPLRACILEQC